MKKILIIAVIIITMTISTIIPASALSLWTPYDGSVYVSTISDYVSVSNIRFSSSGVTFYYDLSQSGYPIFYGSHEIEIRPNSGLHPSDYWNIPDYASGTLPSLYPEGPDDPDDVSLGCFPEYCTPDTAYYGYLWMSDKANPANGTFKVESEWGMWFAAYGDSYPGDYETIKPDLSLHSTFSW